MQFDIICLAPPRFQAPVLVVPGKTRCVFHGNRHWDSSLRGPHEWPWRVVQGHPFARFCPASGGGNLDFFHHEYQPKIGKNMGKMAWLLVRTSLLPYNASDLVQSNIMSRLAHAALT